MSRHICVIDPAVKMAELVTFNNLARLSPLPLSYHLPVFFGFKSLEQEPETLAGIIILGSASSVNERLPWQITLEAWVKAKILAGTPTLGICYGHQMIAHMFGGKVEYHSPGQKKHIGFREMDFSANRLWDDKALKEKLYVRHNEHVTQVPPDFTVCVKSSQIEVDGMSHNKLPVWSFQSHPEATCSFPKEGEPNPNDPKHFEFGHGLIRRFMDFADKARKK